MFNITNSLLLKEESFSYVERVVCNVPVLKLKDANTGISADITFNRDDSFKGVHCALNL